MISALNQRQDYERGFWSGADAYFTKPLDLDVLLERVQELIADRPAS
jgi:DNA-binding response OmpR family regulator